MEQKYVYDIPVLSELRLSKEFVAFGLEEKPYKIINAVHKLNNKESRFFRLTNTECRYAKVRPLTDAMVLSPSSAISMSTWNKVKQHDIVSSFDCKRFIYNRNTKNRMHIIEPLIVEGLKDVLIGDYGNCYIHNGGVFESDREQYAHVLNLLENPTYLVIFKLQANEMPVLQTGNYVSL